MRRSRWLAAAACAALAAGGCGGVGNGSKSGAQAKLDAYCAKQTPDLTGRAPVKDDASLRGNLQYWGWYNGPAQTIFREFKQHFPGVTLTTSQFGLDEVPLKLNNALQAGTGAPDIAMVQDPTGPQFWGGGLLDLRACLKPYLRLFTDAKVAKITTPSGAIQAVPWDGNAMILSYRKSVFDRYGIDASRIVTWDDYIAAGKELSRRSGGKVKMMFSNTHDVVNTSFGPTRPDVMFQALTQQLGGQWYSRDGQRVEVDSPQATQALEMMKRFRDAGITMNDVASANAEVSAVKSGQVASIISVPATIFFLMGVLPSTRGDWRAIPVPAFTPDGNHGADLGGTSMAITDQSSNPEAAWEFLKFWLLRVQGRLDSYRAGLLFEGDYKPVRSEAAFTAGNPFYGGQDTVSLYARSADTGTVFTDSTKLSLVRRALYDGISSFYAGKTSAQQLLTQIDESGNR